MTSLFVGNLSYETTADQLELTFAPFGQVLRVKFITDRDTGQFRGFAFVDFATDEAAKAAIVALDGRELGGRRLVVNVARPREERGGGGGRPSRRDGEGRGEGRGGYGGGRGQGGYGAGRGQGGYGGGHGRDRGERREA